MHKAEQRSLGRSHWSRMASRLVQLQLHGLAAWRRALSSNPTLQQSWLAPLDAGWPHKTP